MDIRSFSWMAVTMVLAAQATAQPGATQAYPARPLQLILSSAPGTPPDTLVRTLSEPLTAGLGQPVVVENRPGGSGTIAMGSVARAAPDGYTLGIVTLQHMVAPALVAEMPYDTIRDLAPVTQLTWTANILVVRASSPLATVSELVAMAKARPGRLAYASAGVGTPSHLAFELFKNHAGIEVQHVPYKGIAAGLAALVGEQVDTAFAGVATALPFIKSGRLRALGTAGARRLPALPDLPTIGELGFPGYQLNEWHGVVAPAGTPQEIIARLAREMTRAVTLPDTEARLARVGLYPAERTGPDALATFIRAELQRWRQIVREAGIRAE
jgi:tripartite-type tricarboxylate transporter receptor subunit TctC